MLAFREENGQGLMEYGLILILIAMVVILIVSVYGGQVSNLFSRVTSAIH